LKDDVLVEVDTVEAGRRFGCMSAEWKTLITETHAMSRKNQHEHVPMSNLACFHLEKYLTNSTSTIISNNVTNN
jgi:hypothetical protein